MLASPSVEKTPRRDDRQQRSKTPRVIGERLISPLLGMLHVLPDFLVIGAARSGTSFLYRNLRRHPGLRSAQHKELHFFDTARYRLGMGWYRRQFPLRTAKLLAGLRRLPFQTGEATPRYLWHAQAAERVARHLPDIRLLALLRQPAERAYSHWAYSIGRGAKLLPFDELVDSEIERGIDAVDTGLLARGIYVDQLARWREHFPAHRLLVLQSEELFRDADTVWVAVLDFLGLPLVPLPSPEVRNRSGADQEMSGAVRERLDAYYRPHNERLFASLGQRYDW